MRARVEKVDVLGWNKSWVACAFRDLFPPYLGKEPILWLPIFAVGISNEKILTDSGLVKKLVMHHILQFSIGR